MPRLTHAKQAAIRDKWFAYTFSTEPANRKAAETGIRSAYRETGYNPPKTIVWVDSPLAGVIAAVRYSLTRKSQHTIWDRIEARTLGHRLELPQITPGPEIGFGTPPNSHSFPWLWATTRQLEDFVQRITIAVDRELVSQCVPGRFWDVIGDCNGLWPNHRSLAYHDAVSRRDPTTRRPDGLITVAQNAGWWWGFKNVAILAERPVKILRDERGRLHCPDGPAILYRDGFGIASWHGVDLPRGFLRSPTTLEDIDATENAEVRRVLIERYGPARYIVDSGAELLHEDEWGTIYRCLLPSDEPLVMVKVVNSTPEPDGGYKDYWIRVHPQLRLMLADGKLGPPQKVTALNAVASTFGLTGEEYLARLIRQT